jgi:hypothetical protein
MSKPYYIYNQCLGRFERVKGRKVIIPGFEQFDFFVHEDDFNKVISSAKAGGFFACGSKGTPTSKVIKYAMQRLKERKITPAKFRKIEARYIKKYGLSPRYDRGEL